MKYSTEWNYVTRWCALFNKHVVTQLSDKIMLIISFLDSLVIVGQGTINRIDLALACPFAFGHSDGQGDYWGYRTYCGHVKCHLPAAYIMSIDHAAYIVSIDHAAYIMSIDHFVFLSIKI